MQTIGSQLMKSVSLDNQSVTIGRDQVCTLYLPAQTVSRHHATIEPTSSGHYAVYDHSTNGTFVNGQRVVGWVKLLDGVNRIQIGPYTLKLLGEELRLVNSGDRLRLEARDLTIQNRSSRRLDNISLTIEPGQLVALVGGSGAGKSTLLRALLGIERLTSGEVHINGDNLQQHFNVYRTLLGYVPQDDVVHQELTVAEVLTYAAKLRLPPDINVFQVVQQTLAEIEMAHCRHTQVKQLSGGQRKRVSIGVELIADPKLFFLDEPTSGLDPGLDKRIMQLLRKLADSGRTVVLVTHATANIKLCDRIAFLGQGGRLCYFGTPQGCLKFFNVKDNDFAQIYNQLETTENVLQQFSRYLESADYQNYVARHTHSYSRTTQRTTTKGQVLPDANNRLRQQLALLTQRYFQSAIRDRLNLVIALLTAPVGVALVALALADVQPFVPGGRASVASAMTALQVLFTFSCAALWVGLSSSLPEIVKESAIYYRERLVNLNLGAYLGSKVCILSLLALWQTAFMVAAIVYYFDSPKSELISWITGVTITTFLTISASLCLGLLVSVIVRNVSQATSSLPFLLIPQIAFSGVLFDLTGISSKLSWLMLSRWSVGAYGTVLGINDMIPTPIKLYGKIIDQPLQVSPVYESSWLNLGLNWLILCVHSAAYLLITYWLLRRKDRCLAKK